jgi:hypothetical protein
VTGEHGCGGCERDRQLGTENGADSIRFDGSRELDWKIRRRAAN